VSRGCYPRIGCVLTRAVSPRFGRDSAEGPLLERIERIGNDEPRIFEAKVAIVRLPAATGSAGATARPWTGVADAAGPRARPRPEIAIRQMKLKPSQDAL
jgi:hypothetical protein